MHQIKKDALIKSFWIQRWKCMKKESDNLVIYSFLSEKYAMMANDYYDKYKEYEKIIDGLCVNNGELLNYYEDFEKFADALYKKDEYAILTVIFRALAIEAYINLICFDLFGSKQCRNNYYDLSTLEKIHKICKHKR